MKIFICWSRGRSQAVATALDTWLPRVVHGVHPFLSSDIEKGRRWFEEISTALRASQSGLVCLTPECLHAPWIHFEAGALAHAVGDRLYTYLHGARPEQLSGPLSAFQSTQATHEDTFRLVSALQRAATPTFDEAALKVRFETAWPELDTALRRVDAVTVDAALPGFAKLFKFKTFTEAMRQCPDFGWIARLERLARVDAVLDERRSDVAELGRPHLVHLYDELRRQLDLYRMNVSAHLLTARVFEVGTDGLLDVPKDALDGCEEPRLRVRELIERLLDPSGAPVTEEALRFDTIDTNQRKLVVHDLERRLRSGQVVLAPEWRAAALGSPWDFDRIAWYLSLEVQTTTEREALDAVEQVRRELELVETRQLRASLMPLYYAVRAVAATVDRIAPISEDLRRATLAIAADIERYVTADPTRDGRGRFVERLAQIRRRLAEGQ